MLLLMIYDDELTITYLDKNRRFKGKRQNKNNRSLEKWGNVSIIGAVYNDYIGFWNLGGFMDVVWKPVEESIGNKL